MATEAVGEAAADAITDAAVALIGATVPLPAGMVMFWVLSANGKLELTATSVMFMGKVPSTILSVRIPQPSCFLLTG
jgi:hypothetical protein